MKEGKAKQIYEYLIAHCLGYENRIKGYQLMQLFNINDHKTLRSYIEEIRQNDEYQYFIGSESGKNGGYFISITNEEKQVSMKHLYLRAMEILKTYGILKRKEIYYESERKD